jgi:hypothetical protein
MDRAKEAVTSADKRQELADAWRTMLSKPTNDKKRETKKKGNGWCVNIAMPAAAKTSPKKIGMVMKALL